MQGKLKEPIEFIQYTGEESIPEIEAFIKKHGYGIDYGYNPKNKRVNATITSYLNPDYPCKFDILLLKGEYIIYHNSMFYCAGIRTPSWAPDMFTILSESEFNKIFEVIE